MHSRNSLISPYSQSKKKSASTFFSRHIALHQFDLLTILEVLENDDKKIEGNFPTEILNENIEKNVFPLSN